MHIRVKVAVVILNWNGRNLLEKFLPGVIRNSAGEAAVYVADNCSTDDSVAYLKNNFPDTGLILLEKNHGFAGGYNECLKNIDASYFILLNSDVEVTPGWITPVIEMMEKDHSIGACQPKILSHAQRDYFEYAGAAGGYLDYYGYPFCRGRIFTSIEKDTGQYDDVQQVFWASGACMFIRASVFKDLKGFDDTFFAHMEEIDLCWRIQRNGFKVMYHPGSVVYHVGGGTLPKSNPRKTYLNFRNNMLMLHKNLPSSRLFPVLVWRLLLDGIAGIKFLISESPADCFAVVKAHFYFYTHLFARIRIRKVSQPVKASPVSGIYKGFLVYDYFIGRIRKFGSLHKNRFL